MAHLLNDAATEHSLILRLVAALVPLSLGVLCLGISSLVTAMRPHKGFFVPPMFRGVLQDGELTDEYLGDTASKLAELRYIFSWKTLPHKQTQFQAVLTPARAKTFKDKTVPEELKLAKQYQVRSDFVVTSTDVLQRQGDYYRVLVHGLRSLWINGVVSEEEMTITFILAPFTMGGHPHGLQVVDYQGTPPLKVTSR